MRKMRVKRPYYEDIMSGVKTLEVRVGYANTKRIRTGELVQLETGYKTGVIQIKEVRKYTSFPDMLAREDWHKIIPQAHSTEEALATFRKIYDRRKESFGVFVFEIKPANI